MDFFRHEMYNSLSHFLVATLGKTVVGYIIFWVITDESHVANLAVHPDYRKQNIGDSLLKFAIYFSLSKGARMMTLEVNENNAAAVALYGKNEFKQVGKRIKYYENRDDAFILTRSL